MMCKYEVEMCRSREVEEKGWKEAPEKLKEVASKKVVGSMSREKRSGCEEVKRASSVSNKGEDQRLDNGKIAKRTWKS